MLREIIKIIEEKCDGCGQCIPNCPEGALQIIDGKARMVSDIFCDGLGACIGHCPQNAIIVEKREAEPYDERKVLIEKIIPHGSNLIKAHLKHLLDHGQNEYYRIAINTLKENNIDIEDFSQKELNSEQKCSIVDSINDIIKNKSIESENERTIKKEINWPIQMHLISPTLPVFENSNVVVSADCSGYLLANFREKYVKDKKLIICCPKLDSGLDIYQEKIKALIEISNIRSLTLITTEVPCCNGLVLIAQKAISSCTRNIPVKWIQLSIKGEKKIDRYIN